MKLIFCYNFLLLILIILSFLYLNKKNTIEKMVDTKEMIDIKDINLEAIKNLSEIAVKLQKGKLTIPGNLKVGGNLIVDKNFNYLPRGTIVAFNGKEAPEGWAICNGGTVKDLNNQNYVTPDLRGRFIYGYNNSGLRNKGGRATVTLQTKHLPVHNHSIKNTSKHSHNPQACKVDDLHHPNDAAGGGFVPVGSDNDTGCQTLDHEYRSDTAGEHNHGGATGNVGSGHAHENLPPYVILLYIIKL